MKQEHRDWFDRVYPLYCTRSDRLPNKTKSFPYVVKRWSLNQLEKIGENLSEEDAKLFLELQNSIPPAEAFIEEKRRVIKELGKELYPIFKDIKQSAYLFGSLIGDIDLFMISKEWRLIPQNVRDKLPLVDWKTIDFFIVPSAEEIVRQLLRFEKAYAIREAPSEIEYLSEKRIERVKQIVKSSKRLLGDVDLESGLSVITPENIRNLALRPFASHYFYCGGRLPENCEPCSLTL